MSEADGASGNAAPLPNLERVEELARRVKAQHLKKGLLTIQGENPDQ